MADDPTRPRQARALPRQPRLLVIQPGGVRAFDLPARRELTLGRSHDADIVIDDPELSRRHARVVFDGSARVTDLESFNGTVVRGTALVPGVPCSLLPGESFEIGGTTVVVESGLMPDPTGPPAAGMEAVHRVADRVAASNISVLLLGETGVGKGVMARRIHQHSPRRAARFLELNCAALPEQLLESELLGHEKGAFTGAATSRPGLLEVADGGTVFLDEVGELPPAVQAKLLRVIEERQVMRIGARQSRTVDVRFVAATNRDLCVEVAEGRFRSDLYYRLNGIALYIPPLRQRRDEILGFARQFVDGGETTRADGRRPRLSSDVEAYLLEHPWPGNVRELRNVIQRAVVLCDGDEIRIEHLFVGSRGSVGPTPVEATGLGQAIRPLPVPPRAEPGGTPQDDERRRILDALERFGGNQTKAARELGMSRTTLSARLDAYGVARPKKGAE